MKWREQRELKKKAEAAKKKSVFAVRHLQHNDNDKTQEIKKPITKPVAKTDLSQKRVTRSSARLAKQPSKTLLGGKTNIKDAKLSKKTTNTKVCMTYTCLIHSLSVITGWIYCHLASLLII